MSFLSEIIASPFITKEIKKLIGGDVIFTSHCDAHLGKFTDDWHKDDGTGKGDESNGYFGERTYGNDDCNVYKVAIYFQDHLRNTGGFSVIEGSHKLDDSNNKGKKN